MHSMLLPLFQLGPYSDSTYIGMYTYIYTLLNTTYQLFCHVSVKYKPTSKKQYAYPGISLLHSDSRDMGSSSHVKRVEFDFIKYNDTREKYQFYINSLLLSTSLQATANCCRKFNVIMITPEKSQIDCTLTSSQRHKLIKRGMCATDGILSINASWRFRGLSCQQQLHLGLRDSGCLLQATQSYKINSVKHSVETVKMPLV